MLEGGRENSRASEGIGSGARCAVEPPKRRWLIQERDGQAEQSLDGEEDGLPTGGDGAPEFELAELLARLANRQIQIVSKLSHMRRLLPAYSSNEAAPARDGRSYLSFS